MKSQDQLSLIDTMADYKRRFRLGTRVEAEIGDRVRSLIVWIEPFWMNGRIVVSVREDGPHPPMLIPVELVTEVRG